MSISLLVPNRTDPTRLTLTTHHTAVSASLSQFHNPSFCFPFFLRSTQPTHFHLYSSHRQTTSSPLVYNTDKPHLFLQKNIGETRERERERVMASANVLVLVLVFLFDIVAFGLAVAAEQRRSTVRSLSLFLSRSL